MKNILIAIGLSMTLTGGGMEIKGEKEVNKATTDSLENVISVLSEKEIEEPLNVPCPGCDSLISVVRKKADSTLKAKIDSIVRVKNNEIRKAFLTGTKTCPECEECDESPLKLLGYEIDHEFLFVETNKGKDSIKVHRKIGSKPTDQK